MCSQPVAEGVGRGLRLAPVALDHVGPLDPQLADLADGHLVALGVDDLDRHHRDGRADAVRLGLVVRPGFMVDSDDVSVSP